VHWMFRLGLISLADDLQILVSRQVNDPDGIQAMINNSVTPCRRYERRIGRIRISSTGIVRTASNFEGGIPAFGAQASRSAMNSPLVALRSVPRWWESPSSSEYQHGTSTTRDIEPMRIV